MRFIDFDSTGRRTGKGQKQKIRFRVPHAQQTASAPTLSFGDGDTGMWEPQDDVLQFGTAGNQKLEINASGQVGIGGITPIYDLHVGSASGGHYFQRYASDASPPTLCLDKSRHDTIGSHTIVADNDVLGAIIFKGSDGSAFRNAAVIRCDVDGTPGSSDMPGELLFQVTPDGSATAATAMTISPDKTVTLAGNLVVSGTTTTIDSTTLTVDDKNIELGSVASPSDTTADGGGITLKGATDKTIVWTDSQDAWVYNQGITVGVDDTGHDVTFFGATSGAYMKWNQATDDLQLVGAAGLDIAGDVDVDGTTNLDAVDIDGAVQIDGTVTVGVDDTGQDVKFFGATTGKSWLWDESADKMIITGDTQLTGSVTIGVDDTGHDVTFWGATTGAKMVWAQASDHLFIRGGAASPGKLVLQTAETTVVDGNKIGQIDFQAPLDSAGTDAVLVGASIWAESNDTFSASVNNTELVLATGLSETATEKMRITSDGKAGIGTPTPASILHLNGSNAQLRIEEDTDNDHMYLDMVQGGRARINTSDQRLLTVQEDGGNLGIGTTSSSAKVTIKIGTGNDALRLMTDGTHGVKPWISFDSGLSGTNYGEKARIQGGYDSGTGGGGGYLAFSTKNTSESLTSRMVIDSSGNTGIANTAPADKLWVQGGISATGDITSSASDKRLKENRKPISNAVEKVLKLKGITYDWIDNISEVTGTEWNHTEKQAGLIAQDVQKVLPEAVSIAPFDKDGEGKSVSGKDYLTIDYARVVPLLVNAIKEQQVQIEELKKEIKE